MLLLPCSEQFYLKDKKKKMYLTSNSAAATELFICLCDFILPNKSCSPHMTGSSAAHGTDTAEGVSLGDRVINVSALTTCSAQVGPLLIRQWGWGCGRCAWVWGVAKVFGGRG